jgi:hypothetical protein
LGDEEWIAIQLQVLGNLGSMALKVGDGLDVGDGWHSDPFAIVRLNVGPSLVIIKKFAERRCAVPDPA